MSLLDWALWALAGAFAYATPRLITATFDAKPNGSRGKAVAEYVFALATGPIAGAGIGPYLAAELHRSTGTECRALAIITGLLVNPVAPVAVHLMTDVVLARLGHPIARKKD